VANFLTAEQILAANDLEKEAIDIPEWGGKVWIRTMMADERDSYEQEFVDLRRGYTKKGKMKSVRAKFCALVLCDENMQRLFTEEQVVALGEKSAKALDRVFEAGLKLNGFSQNDVEVLAGN
jgi:hypothetical protein